MEVARVNEKDLFALSRREFLRRSAWASAAAIAAACAPATTPSGTATSSPGATQAVLTPKKGGTLTWAQWDKTDSIDPALTTGAAAGEIVQNVCDTLITMDADQKFSPALASKWAVEDGGKKFTFTLRDGVKFHDGAALTAAAVKGSFERIRDPNLKAGAVISLLGSLDTITTPDEKTVVFTFKQPYYAFMLQIWRYFFGILSPNQLSALKSGEAVKQPIGSGPFKVVNRSADGVWTLEAFPDYAWGAPIFQNKAAPYLAGMKLRAITEASTRTATLESGENLVIDEITETDYSRLKNDKRFTFVESPRASHTIGFSMNVQLAPTNDKAVREAVNWAVDRRSIVDKLFFGVHKVSVGPLSQGVWARLEELEKTFAYDPAKAKQILETAGWKGSPIREKDGKKLEILLATFRSPWTEVAEAMQAQLREVGIDLKVQKMERAPYLDHVRAYKHNMAATSSTSVDPDGILRVVYHSAGLKGGSNFSNLNDPALDALLTKGAGQELGTADRRKTYEDAQRMIMAHIPFVGVFSQVRVTAMSAKVKGFKPGPDGFTAVALNDVWLDQ
ncbi:MAG TPA: ABC transporter substrate-binding protein [Candidatus Limnocylindria bacterium]